MDATRNLNVMPPAKAWLVVHGGPNDGAMLRLRRKALTIGHGSKAALALEDKTVSAEHVRIRPDGDTFTLADMASRNGTFVNGQAIREEVHLKDGDVIRIGQTVLVYKYVPAHAGQASLSGPGVSS
jgi:pSer/pThr/pTyr-binding forkhead associated (FHA) protein